MTESQKLVNLIRMTIREELEYTKKQIIAEMQTITGQSMIPLQENHIPKVFNQFSPPPTPSTPVGNPTISHRMEAGNFFADMVKMKANDPDYIAQKMASR